MVMAPSRLEQDFGVRFATVQFQGHGRGHGSCHWEWDADIPDRVQLLEALRNKLSRSIDTIDLELGFLEPLLSPTSALVQPVPTVRYSPPLASASVPVRCGCG